MEDHRMEWTPGDLVWFDPGVGHWLPGEVLECHRSANVLTVQAVINGKPKNFALTGGEGSVRSRQDLGAHGVEDMTKLTDLHEAALLWNLKLRYDRNLIYTYAGSILVAVNPYRMFDSSYGLEAAQRYKDELIGNLPPHLFAIASAAYAALPAPQVVVISGESGSGKTESTKLVMQYLAAVAPSAPRGQALVTEQILEAAPLLEAFGNARTTRNDNSSRFGKYLEVYFKQGAIVGARVTQYLLEKSRIVTQAAGERNYHVFYELLGGLGSLERQKYGLVEADKYFYLNQGGSDCTPGHSGTGSDWGALTRAMQVLGVGEAELEGIVKVLASVLHLGNVYFHRRQLRHGQEGVEIGSDVEIKWAAHLLQISASGMQRVLTTRTTEARTERVHSPLSIDQALDARDAFAKALYAALFSWLVTRVNSIVQKGGLHDASRISLLDIFGFENLAENSFEQLCINYASESLQLYFNKYIFKLEQQEYAREKLEWTNLTWNDNTPVLHLLGKKPVGILHLLDDESNFPKASDHSFLEKCHYNHALNENYSRPRVGGREFAIRHFAGQVWYSVECFLDKNRDALRPEIIELLASSKEPLVCAIAKPLFSQAQTRTLPRGANGRFVTMKPRTPTVAARFSDSLHMLVESMSRCNPWFVRCVKPNNDKMPMRFDMPVVLEQLLYSGMLETIHIRQAGYPMRMKFQIFVERYRYLVPGGLSRGAPYRDLCRAILDQLPQSGTVGPDYQLGATRVFLRENLERQLETTRVHLLQNAATVLQKHIRGYLTRKNYLGLKRSSVVIQRHWRGYRDRRSYNVLRHGIVQAQALYRGKLERKRYAARKSEFKKRKEAERLAQEKSKAKSRPRPNNTGSNNTTTSHLEIPAELAFIFSKLDNFTPIHTERNLAKIAGFNQDFPQIFLPPDLEQFEFNKFTSVYFKGAEFNCKKEPIVAPFLSKAAARDQDFQDAVALFKLILRWSNDRQLAGSREKILADYVVHKGLSSRSLRDEILVQLCNQTRKNENAERLWQLMAHCLSCFQPSPPLSKYLLKYITDHSTHTYKEILQRKLLRGLQKSPHSRSLPPTLLEYRQKSQTALTVTLADATSTTVLADSWTTCEEAAGEALPGIAGEGWSVVLDDAGVLNDSNGLDYVFDLIGELELCPAWPVATRSGLLKVGVRSVATPAVELEVVRPQVPPPEPPSNVPGVVLPQASSRRASGVEYSPVPVSTSTPSRRKPSHEGLSRSSALNERYFDVEKARSRSLDNLLSEPEPPGQLAADFGLSQSRLNERYHSVEQLAPIQPVLSNASYSKHHHELEFEYPDGGSSIAASNRGRYIKSQNVGKKSVATTAGSQSSRAQIEKTEIGVKSSAMSDTSEAPSLASHVRRVRVPSQASDVDQFLDELFSPVLDGNLDELSDARSLAASIKGGESLQHFLGLDNDDLGLSDVSLLCKVIKGGGETDENREENYMGELFRPIFVSDSVKTLTDKHELVGSIKGGGTTHQSGSNYSTPSQDNNLLSLFGVQGLNLPPNTDIAAYQQNLQRAFLQSAMAQNIQIQQQLLAQNQALQQLLNESKNEPKTSPTTSSFRKVSSDSTNHHHHRNSSVPPPPPLPPPLDPSDPSETRPFMDPYGRAKTVRIGKWRWPPPKDGNTPPTAEDFVQFKMRQSHRKITPNQQTSSSSEWEEIVDFEPVEKNQPAKSRKSFEIGASRPSPGSIGKIKLSSEMRQRLEQVTSNHSIRSTSSSQMEKPKKLEDARRMMLEQQLTGRSWDANSPSDSPNNWRPPPPPIGPNSLPPVPTVPPPSPPTRPQPPPVTEPSTSFISQLQDRDTFGVHQTGKRNSHDWEVHDQDNVRYLRRDSWEQNVTESLLLHQDWDHGENPVRSTVKEPAERPTFRTHQMNKVAQEREKKHSTSTLTTDKLEVADWPEFMKPIRTPPKSKSPTPDDQDTVDDSSPKTTPRPRSFAAPSCVAYNRVPWTLRVRKEVFSPNESLGSTPAQHLIFCQIVGDVYGATPCLRLAQNDRRNGMNMLSGYGVKPENVNSPHRAHIKRSIIELARTWPLYFSRLFTVSGAAQFSEVQLVAVSHWGVHLVKRDGNGLYAIVSFGLSEIGLCSAPRPTSINLETPQGRITLHTPRAQQLSEMVGKFCKEQRKIQNKSPTPQRNIPLEKLENGNAAVPELLVENSRTEVRATSPRGRRISSPGSPQPPTGKYSLIQFAMHNFRQNSELELLKMDSSLKSKEKRKEWTWKQQTDLVKWQGNPLEGPLLNLDNPELAPLAVECFECILRYSGDLPYTPGMSEVKCVYTVLMHCHKHILLRDEVYCQLIKQTTSNKSENPESTQRAWRLLSIVAAYFACSEVLRPYLLEHLTSAASDRRRVCHGTAAVCLANLRKTQRCGGRKNVPSVEEVTAVSAGRSARRQIYRLPGGAERVVNTKCSTVVADVISELCGLIGVTTESEQREFSLYCIVQGDAFTMPLAADEYILDVTTELHKAAQPFYLIFCRSVWYHPLKHDASVLYTEVLFNQVAPDYLEGLLLKLGTPNLPPSTVRDVALIAALLHRAADLGHSPSLKEVKFLLPKPVLGLREPRPPQWLALVQTSWGQAAGLQTTRAKHKVLQVLSNWPLFGSSFFAIKRVSGDLENWSEYILALNRSGVYFLDMMNHETIFHWPFAEVISTRKVRSEDGALFLDMKCGNLLQQRVTRLQTEQAHEISRLVRQYINLEQASSNNRIKN